MWIYTQKKSIFLIMIGIRKLPKFFEACFSLQWIKYKQMNKKKSWKACWDTCLSPRSHPSLYSLKIGFSLKGRTSFKVPWTQGKTQKLSKKSSSSQRVYLNFLKNFHCHVRRDKILSCMLQSIWHPWSHNNRSYSPHFRMPPEVSLTLAKNHQRSIVTSG